MSLFKCPLCGKRNSVRLYDPSNFESDIIGVDVSGLGRGGGFVDTNHFSLLGDSHLTELISRRCRKILGFIERSEPVSNKELKSYVTAINEWKKWGENTQRRLGDSEVIINNFEEQHRNLKKEIYTLREQLARHGASVHAAEAEQLRRTVREWAAWGEQTKKALKEKDTEITSLRAENKRLSKSVSSLREELKDAEEESTSAAEAEELLDRINASCNTDYDDLGEAIDFLLE